MGRYLTERERYKIESWLQDNIEVKVIAERLGKTKKTIYNEIKRGTVEFLDSNLKPYTKYCADVAQEKYDQNKHNKGTKSYLHDNYDLCLYISDMILNQKLSPFAISELLKDIDFKFKPSVHTIYNYIYAGLIPNVTASDLIYKKKESIEK